MKILVTGGAGFIGSNAVNFFLEKGFEVNVVDDLSRGFKELVNQKAEFFEGSFGDKKVLDKALKGVEAVIHFGAFALVEESVENPQKYFKNNVINSVVLLEEMRKKGINKMVFSSSCSVYGEPEKVPITESHLLNPVSPYGETKKAFEKILELYFHSFKMNSICLRYFNPFGPNELHKPETHAIPNFIKAVLRKEKISVFGDGNQIRDFFFVEDLIKAHFLALEKIDEFGFEVFNVGSGSGHSVNETINAVFELTGKKTEIQFLPERKGDPKKLIADTKKIQENLGWKPETEFKQG
ncbi:UDP-glucose 4-epimerase GalE, partial [Candidatus Micrarchaeota archaeon]|nr:UDP-glucose 4-epimerase GalE [Candidatus Micrarchaeota archaeon]